MLSIIGLVLDTGIEKNTQIFFDTFDTFDTGIEKNTQIIGSVLRYLRYRYREKYIDYRFGPSIPSIPVSRKIHIFSSIPSIPRYLQNTLFSQYLRYLDTSQTHFFHDTYDTSIPTKHDTFDTCACFGRRYLRYLHNFV